MTCPFRWLVITDGTLSDAGIRNQVNLLSDHSGFCVTEWEPAITTLKGGGTWKDSSLANGRRLALNKKANVIETMTVEIRDADADTLIRDTQELRRLLEKARTYWTTSWQTGPVWLEAQGIGESNIRYTLIMDWQTPNDGDPYEQPFWQNVAKAGMDDFSLIFEREPFWRADMPGESTCVAVTASQVYEGTGPFFLELNGTNADVDCGSNALLDDLHTADFMVDGWWKPGGTSGVTFIGKTGGSREGWWLQEYLGTLRGVANYLPAADSRSVVGTVQAGVWQYFAMTFELATRQIRLWIGANEVTYSLQQTGTAPIISDAALNLYIGSFNSAANFFTDAVGWVRISNNLRHTTAVITVPERCALPAIDANTIAQWIGVEESGATIDNQEGTAALDGTQVNCTFNACQEMGRAVETCLDEVYIANKHNQANITHIFTWSAANGFSANLQTGGLPYDLIDIAGAAPAVNDYVVFGIDTTLADSGPFSSLVFDIGTAISGITVDDWEYSTGGPGWANLAAEQDNTDQDGAGGGSAFDTTGVKSVHWKQPAAWLPQAENTVTGYWIRCLVTAAPGPHVAPTQQNRSVYTIVWPYIEVDAEEVGGDVSALVHHKIRNQSDTSHGGGVEANSQRFIIGLRSLSRGENYSAYINLADEQNHNDITITALLGAIITDTTAPSGRVFPITNPAGWLPWCQVTINTPLSQEYSGRFHAYLRGQQTSGVAGDVSLYVRGLYSGNLEFWRSPVVTFPTVNAWQLLDLGAITIDNYVSGKLQWFTLFEIAASGNGTSDAKLYDLILMPVDEWSIDTRDILLGALGWGKIGYRSSPSANNAYLSLDPLTDPKTFSSLVTRYVDDRWRESWLKVYTGHPVLQANSAQRIWFLSSRHESATDERSECEVASTVQLSATQRYFSMRGNR